MKQLFLLGICAVFLASCSSLTKPSTTLAQEAKTIRNYEKTKDTLVARQQVKALNSPITSDDDPVGSNDSDGSTDPTATSGATGSDPKDKVIENLFTRIEELDREVSLAELKAVSIGFSVGPRFSSQDSYEYSIANDGTLIRDALTSNTFIISSSLNILPFTKNQMVQNRIRYYEDAGRPTRSFLWKMVQNVGIFVNVNLIDISTERTELSFNEAVDGGVGVGFRLAPKIYIAYGLEFFTNRQIRGFYANQLGQSIMVDGQPLTTLDAGDDRFFRNNTSTGWSLRLILGL